MRTKTLYLRHSHPLAKGLLGAWVMTEGDGPDVRDLSGNWNHGTLNGSAAWELAEDGPRVDFPGGSDYISCGSTPLFHVPEMTVAAWVTSDVNTQLLTAVSRHDGTNEQFLLGHGSTGTYRFSVYTTVSGTSSIKTAESATGFSTGTPHLLVGTYRVGEGRIYVDGVFTDDIQTSGTIDADLVDLRIGGRASGSNSWNGSVHSVFIWNWALPPTLVARFCQNPYGMFERRQLLFIQQTSQIGIGNIADAATECFQGTSITPDVGTGNTAESIATAFQGTGFVTQTDISFAFEDTYQILKAETTVDGAAVIFEVGSVNLFKQRMPPNIWHADRCEWVYKSVECGYGRDDFAGASAIDILVSRDGIKYQGWRALNFTNASITQADIHLSINSYYTVTLQPNTTVYWSGVARTAPYLYRLFPFATGAAGDFDVEIFADGTANESEESEGLLLTENLDDPNDWIHFRRQFRSGAMHLIGSKMEDGVVENILFDVVSSGRYLRLKRETMFTTEIDEQGLLVEVSTTLFKFYYKVVDTDLWVLAAETAQNNLIDVDFRLGLCAATNTPLRTTAFQAKFDYFRMTSGGLPTCIRTLLACSEHENTRRYGGAPGILRGPLLL